MRLAAPWMLLLLALPMLALVMLWLRGGSRPRMRYSSLRLLGAAKYAQNGVIFSQCEWFNTWLPIYDIGLFRNTFSADPASPQQPQPAYYVLRNMSTILAETTPARHKVEFSDKSKGFQYYSYDKEGKPMVAVHLHGWGKSGKTPRYADDKTSTGFVLAISAELPAPIDDVSPSVTDVTIENVTAKKVFGTDSFNGLRQELVFESSGGDIVVKNTVVRDYPLFIELE